MAEDPTGPRLHPRLVREFPPDLALCLVVTALTVLTIALPVVRDSPLRVVVGLPFVLFVPGYALVAALFPEAGSALGEGETDAGDEGSRDADAGGEESGHAEAGAAEGGETDAGEAEAGETESDLADAATEATSVRDGIERVALSFGLSIAVVPLLGLGLNFTPWGIRLAPILVAVGGFTVVGSVVAAFRRLALPEAERFQVPYRAWLAAGRAELFEPDSRTDAALNVLLVLSVVLAASSVVYAVAVPKQGETFTEFYVLTEDESGDLVADGYPTAFTVGQSQPVVLGIGNQEFERVDYDLVVVLQNVTFEPGGAPANGTANATVATVVEERELDRFGVEVAHNETWQDTFQVRPRMTGENLRLAFLLYRDGVPATPTVDNAYRELHLWINVSGSGN